MEAPLVEFLWTGCNAGVRRCLGWSCLADVRTAVEAVRVLHFVEWFCGTGNLTAACRRLGLRVGWFDWNLDFKGMNLLSDKGMARAIELSLSLMVGATAWFGVPCSTFVFMSRGHTLRSREQPLGNTSRRDVQSANLIVGRVTFLVRILAMRKVYWILEQPLNSLLWVMPVLRQAQKDCSVRGLAWQRRFVWMGHFGHTLWKPTELVGVFPSLDRSFPSKRPPKRNTSGAYSKWRNKHGVHRCSGHPGLKATEHYPAAFCRVAARLIKQQL
jgi:hypothetical protein